MSQDTPPPPPTPPPPSSEWTAPPPDAGSRPRRRRRWPWLLGGVLALVAILITTAIVLFVVKIKPPVDAANDFLEDVEEGDFDRAFESLCAADQERGTPEDLTPLDLSEIAEDHDVDAVFGVDIDGDRATVEFDSDAVDNDFDYFELPLRKEDGDWHVCLSDDPFGTEFFDGRQLEQQ